MIRRPPRSTLFPYTRSSDLDRERHHPGDDLVLGQARNQQPDRNEASAHRSEEHTSELQSLAYLVCRLLLEKKKANITLERHVAQLNVQCAIQSFLFFNCLLY